MKYLFLISDKIGLYDIPWGLTELGECVEIYDRQITLQSYVEAEKKALTDFLQKNDFDAAVTHNFSPTVSDACEACQVKYIAWIFDSPQIDLYTASFYNSCNYLFVFDKKECERLAVRKPLHLYHMPLAANVSKAARLDISKEDEKQYGCEISFVGGLYEENEWNRNLSVVPQDIRIKMENWMEQKVFSWEKGESLFGCLDETDSRRIQEQCYLGEWVDLNTEYFLENHFLVRKMAELERTLLLDALAERYPVHLYTGSNAEKLCNVISHPPVDYSDVMPKIYHLSRINLNLTLRSIETGAPQRIFDIMSVGGFVMSNYQEELEELFVPDREIVLFHNPEEMFDKVEYYRTHEEERLRIAMNGYRKVKDTYSYPVILQKIIEQVQKDS